MSLFQSTRALLGRGRSASSAPTLYLVSTAGHPNYGDELIARAWLDTLARLHPGSDVWLDCPHPGRAAHLLRDTHPRLRTTNTLWELAHGSPSHDPIEDTERVARLVRDLGSPRIDPGLLALRDVSSVHLLGGGHLNDLWQDNLGIVAAVAELRRAFGVRVFATGLGLLPLSAERQAWLAAQVAVFESIEVRDQGSADAIGRDVGVDDAFLALATDRPAFDTAAAPKNMVLVQGDLRAWTDDEAIASITGFVGDARDHEIGFVEAIPPDDAAYLGRTRPDAQFYPFGRIWADGLPAKAGQRWLTTRFHAHLMAAAAGASGTVIAGRAGYYDHKHNSLLALGTGWNLVAAGTPSAEAEPTSNPAFPARARELAALKRTQAERLYPA